MSYTYLPRTPFRNAPTIIMTTPPSSKKTSNMAVPWVVVVMVVICGGAETINRSLRNRSSPIYNSYKKSQKVV